MLALEGLGARVGLVTRALTALVALEALARRLGVLDLPAQLGSLLVELGADGLELSPAPGVRPGEGAGCGLAEAIMPSEECGLGDGLNGQGP